MASSGIVHVMLVVALFTVSTMAQSTRWPVSAPTASPPKSWSVQPPSPAVQPPSRWPVSPPTSSLPTSPPVQPPSEAPQAPSPTPVTVEPPSSPPPSTDTSPPSPWISTPPAVPPSWISMPPAEAPTENGAILNRFTAAGSLAVGLFAAVLVM